MIKLISLFSGCGGLDLGFRKAGFDIMWGNDYDCDIWKTYMLNHPNTTLDTRDITSIPSNEIPDCDGIIGGPPCQPWSEGGKMLGLEDKRGLVFYEYVRILKAKQPKFFLIENVAGMLMRQHEKALKDFKTHFVNAGYSLSCTLLNTVDFKIPQDRKRVFFIGIRNDLHFKYIYPTPDNSSIITLSQAIGNIIEEPRAYTTEKIIKGNSSLLNHEYYSGSYDNKYMARNRVRSWDEVSFTIQALAKNAPIHPQAPKMIYVNENKRIFVKGKESLYRRLSIRECARIQTFPDYFNFLYEDIKAGYKMVGNAVPPRLAYNLAVSIKQQLRLFI